MSEYIESSARMDYVSSSTTLSFPRWRVPVADLEYASGKLNVMAPVFSVQNVVNR